MSSEYSFSEEEIEALNKSILAKVDLLKKVTYFGTQRYLDYEGLRFNKNEFVLLFSNRQVARNLLVKLNYSNYILRTLFRKNYEMYKDTYHYLLRQDGCPSFIKTFLCDQGFLDDFDLLGEWFNTDCVLSRYAAEYCNKKFFKEGLKSKDARTRLILYQRIGLDDCFDDMVNDSSKDVRKVAAKFLNKDDPRLLKMSMDKSQEVISVVAKKLDKDKLSMLFKNPKSFGKNVSGVLKERF